MRRRAFIAMMCGAFVLPLSGHQRTGLGKPSALSAGEPVSEVPMATHMSRYSGHDGMTRSEPTTTSGFVPILSVRTTSPKSVS